jgi:hypothetical protein
MINAENLAKYLVDELFKLGSEHEHECYRIAFKCGSFQNETSGGGMAKEPLIRFFTEKLEVINT